MFGAWPVFRRASATGALAEFYAANSPDTHTPISELEFLAVDVETTGLDPKKDRLLSIGWVPIVGGRIVLREAGYVLLRQNYTVGESAVVHHLTDAALREGVERGAMLEMVLAALRGRVLLAHFSSIEQRFLSAACRAEHGAALKVSTVDTFQLERRHMERMATYPRGEDLRLPRVRERYGLPRYRSHNALIDAIACAELFLAFHAHYNYPDLRSVMLS